MPRVIPPKSPPREKEGSISITVEALSFPHIGIANRFLVSKSSGFVLTHFAFDAPQLDGAFRATLGFHIPSMHENGIVANLRDFWARGHSAFPDDAQTWQARTPSYGNAGSFLVADIVHIVTRGDLSEVNFHTFSHWKVFQLSQRKGVDSLNAEAVLLLRMPTAMIFPWLEKLLEDAPIS